MARGAHLDAVRRDGLTLAAPEGTRTVRRHRRRTPARRCRRADGVTVLLAVKSHQTHAAVEDLTSVLGPTTPVVSVQNGVANEPTLLRFFDDVQGVCVMMPTGHLEPGVVEQHCTPVPGILDVGRFPGGVDATSRAVADAFGRAGFVSVPREDVMAWKHRKLIMNLGNAVQACCAPGPDTDTLRGPGEPGGRGGPGGGRDPRRRRRGGPRASRRHPADRSDRRARAVRRLVVAEPAAGDRQHRDRLPQR